LLRDQGYTPKKILVFSPHPDDDVISMGGTFIRLVEQGHEVHVAYQTSGNIAVWDEDVSRHLDFVTNFLKTFQFSGLEQSVEMEEKINQLITLKKVGEHDSPEVLKIKGLIRYTEAKSGALYCGVKPENIHFLNLPFYETGTIKKKPLGEDDVQIVLDLIKKISPNQIYAAGDLSDPHGTHRVCLNAVLQALDRVKDEDFYDNCQFFLYRGAWEEWEPHDITMAIPISPDELLQKRYAIFKHQSQKDPPPFPGDDSREFWQRSECRNKETAKIYDKLGLTEYEAMEAFVECDIRKGDHHIYI